MGRSKLKKRLKFGELKEEEPTSTKVPITNLPEKFLWMHVKSGTKIRNVLGYALKEFPGHNSIVWTGVGRGIAKAISCAELFKRKHEALHQITKLRYIESEKSKEDAPSDAETRHRVPEIHILLTKSIKDPTELGYQAPGDRGEFPEKDEAVEPKTSSATESVSHGTGIHAEQFAAMGLRIGQKRPKEPQTQPPPKKNRSKL